VRSTPIGLAMLKDERPHVVAGNEEDTAPELRHWEAPIRERLAATGGPSPELVVGAETVKACAAPSRSASSCAGRAAAEV
jgi:L-fucose isomerase